MIFFSTLQACRNYSFALIFRCHFATFILCFFQGCALALLHYYQAADSPKPHRLCCPTSVSQGLRLLHLLWAESGLPLRSDILFPGQPVPRKVELRKKTDLPLLFLISHPNEGRQERNLTLTFTHHKPLPEDLQGLFTSTVDVWAI